MSCANNVLLTALVANILRNELFVQTNARFQFVWHIRTNLQVACVTDPIISEQLETFRLAFQFVDFKLVPTLREL